MKIVKFFAGDTLELKKPHPCGKRLFKVLRTGSDVRLVCLGCGRDMVVARERLDRSIKNVIPAEDEKSDG